MRKKMKGLTILTEDLHIGDILLFTYYGYGIFKIGIFDHSKVEKRFHEFKFKNGNLCIKIYITFYYSNNETYSYHVIISFSCQIHNNQNSNISLQFFSCDVVVARK